MKAAEYCQRFNLAFFISVASTNTASIVLFPRRNPNCSDPSKPLASAASVM